MPTPVATAQLSASVQEDPRSAGTGGDAWRDPFHAVSSTRCVTKPANAPAP
jgi:hypothetical protein